MSQRSIKNQNVGFQSFTTNISYQKSDKYCIKVDSAWIILSLHNFPVILYGQRLVRMRETVRRSAKNSTFLSDISAANFSEKKNRKFWCFLWLFCVLKYFVFSLNLSCSPVVFHISHNSAGSCVFFCSFLENFLN